MIFYAAIFLFACFVACLLLFLWMRWHMKASKGRFALTVVSTLLFCLLSGLSAMSSDLLGSVASKISMALGHGPIEIGAPKVLVLALTIIAMFLIYRFGMVTIKSWEGPIHVSDIDLSENYLDTNLVALTVEQLKLLTRGQNDRLASDTAANWQVKISEVPKPIPRKDLLKDMLVAAINEIRIQDDGWRDDGKFWIGKMLGLRSKDDCEIIVLVCDGPPTQKEIREKIIGLSDKFGPLDEFRLFAVYFSLEIDELVSKKIEAAGRTVAVWSSRDMILEGLDLQSYARDIIDAFETTRVGGTSVTLNDSYVELTVSDSANNAFAGGLSENLSCWLSRNSGEHIALTGEYGQGKSTALLKFCYDWAKRFVESGIVSERIPLLIELRGKSPSETDPIGFISQWCARYHLQPQQVMNLIKAGEAIVIFEGFDELKNSGRAFYRHQHFNALWRFAYPRTKIIFTGRPNFFLDDKEANRTLRSQETRKVSGDVYTSIWRINKLNREQISVACRSYERETKLGIASAIADNAEFFDILSRPSMLPVVATIWNDINSIRKRGSPLTGAVLIEKYIQAVFSRKEAELERDRTKMDAPSGSKYLVLPKQVRELLTICVAWRMSGLKAKNTIVRSEINEMIHDVYGTLFSLAKSESVSPDIAAGLIEFEKRFRDESHAEKVEAITSEICSAGLLVSDEAGGASNLRFPHKQFFEFLIAKSVVIATNPNKFMAVDLLEKSSKRTAILVRLNTERNAIAYLVEMIGPEVNRLFTRFERFYCQIYMMFLKISRKVSRENFVSDNQTDLSTNNSDVSVEVLFGEGRRSTIFTPEVFLFLLAFLALIPVGLYSDVGAYSILFPYTIGITVVLIYPIVLIARQYHLPVLIIFLRVAWKVFGSCPSSGNRELELAIHSIRSGSVQFEKIAEKSNLNNVDYDQFVYPAHDFGRP